MFSTGAQAGINTVVVATPLLGGIVAYLVATTPAANAGLISRALGGALFGGSFAGVWEYTVNSSDADAVKWEIILGCAAIGAGAGIIGPSIF
jgi:hypothetical protein